MKRKIVAVLLTTTLLLGGCGSNIEKRQIHTTIGQIVDVQYRPAYGNIEEDYSTFIRCNNIMYNLDSKAVYLLCKDKIAEEIMVNYNVIYYKDGTIETYVEVGGHR